MRREVSTSEEFCPSYMFKKLVEEVRTSHNQRYPLSLYAIGLRKTATAKIHINIDIRGRGELICHQ